MKRLRNSLFALFFTASILTGCTEEQPVDLTQPSPEVYEITRAAFEYVNTLDGVTIMDGDLEQATVESTVVDDRYALLDEGYLGQEAWLVTFPMDENRVLETPPVLIAPETYDVIGLMPSE